MLISQKKYVQETVRHPEKAHTPLRKQQNKSSAKKPSKPVQTVDLVLIQSMRRKTEENPNLQPMFVGLYVKITTFKNHTY